MTSQRSNNPPAGTPEPHRATRRVAAQAWIRRHLVLTAAVSAALIVAVVLVVRRLPATADAGTGTSATPSKDGTKGIGGASSMAGMSGMSTDGAVHLTPGQITTFGVTFGTVEQRTLSTEVRTVGTVTIDESRMAMVTPKINGFVERLYVNTTGEPVRRGEPLAEVYSPDLLAAEEEF